MSCLSSLRDLKRDQFQRHPALSLGQRIAPKMNKDSQILELKKRRWHGVVLKICLTSWIEGLDHPRSCEIFHLPSVPLHPLQTLQPQPELPCLAGLPHAVPPSKGNGRDAAVSPVHQRVEGNGPKERGHAIHFLIFLRFKLLWVNLSLLTGRPKMLKHLPPGGVVVYKCPVKSGRVSRLSVRPSHTQNDECGNRLVTGHTLWP